MKRISMQCLVIVLFVAVFYSFAANKVNKKYSYGTFKRQSFLLTPAKDFDSTDIVGSSFYQTEPYTNVFPDNIKAVRFIRCNMDNCVIPSGATVIGGTNKHFKTMNDQEYWIVDTEMKPIAPRDVDRFIVSKVSVSPDSIPKSPLAEPITYTKDPVRLEQKAIDSLKNDDSALKQILIDAGKLPASEGVADEK